MKKICTKLKKGFDPIFDIIIPKGKDQNMMFSCFFCFYAIFSVLMYLKFKDSFPLHGLGYDPIFRLYNLTTIDSFFYPAGGLRHPLFIPLLSPLIVLASILKKISGELALQVPLLMLFFNLVAASSILTIYKYCTKLLSISQKRALLICILFGLFSHFLFLSFTLETFPLSMWGLLILVYITTNNILSAQKIPTTTNVILFCFITGITISNGLKCLVAQLFQLGRFKIKIKTFLISGTICLGSIILYSLISYCAAMIFAGGWSWEHLKIEHTSLWISSEIAPNIFHDLFCEPLLFHHNYNDFWVDIMEKPLIYNTIFPLIICILFYSIIIFSFAISIRERSVIFLISLFLTDILIHIICEFGIRELYIYCSHWFFMLPLLIGWLYKKLKAEKTKKVLDIVLVIFCISFAINNIPRLLDALLFQQFTLFQ